MSVFTLDCKRCSFKTGSYNSWRKHLLEESHQVETREGSKTFTLTEKKKSVVVFGLMSVRNKDVLKYFGDLTIVMDFVFWKERPDFCIIKFFMKKFRDNILTSAHHIQEHQLYLRPRNDISDVEWISICPFAANLKVEVDFGESTSPEDPFNDTSEDEEMDKFSLEENGHSTSQSNEISDSAISVNSLNLEDAENEPRRKRTRLDSAYNKEQADFNQSCQKASEIDSESIHLENAKIDEKERILNLTLEDLYNANLMSPDDWNFRNIAKEELENLLRIVYPKCILIPFGIGSTAISSGNEIFSVYADIYGRTKVESNSTVRQECNMDLTKEMSEILCQKIVELMQSFSSTNGSISMLKYEADEINFFYSKDGRLLKCKLQGTNFLAVQCCRLLNFLCSLDYRVRPMLIIARHWAYHHNLVKSNPTIDQPKETCFLPAVIQWLVVFFLNQKNIIPLVSTLQNQAEAALMHTGVNIAFCNDPDKIGWTRKVDFETNPTTGNPSARCILTLAEEMFDYFGKLNLRKQIVCVATGRIIKKQIINQLKEGKRAELNDNSLEHLKKLDLSRVCIQHPLKPFINMTNEVRCSTADVFKKENIHTAKVIRTLLLGNSVDLNPVTALTIKRNSNLIQDPVDDLLPEEDKDKSTSDSGIQSGEPKKKIKKFSLVFNIEKKFREQAIMPLNTQLEIIELDSKLMEIWLRFFEDFNCLVWHCCFGVKLFSLTDESRVKGSQKSLGPPLKGVLINPNKFAWIKRKALYKPRKTAVGGTSEFEEIRSTMAELLKKSSPSPIISADDQTLAELVSERLFSFHCQMYVSPGKSTAKGQVSIDFIKMQGTEIRSKLKLNLREMYTALWEDYSSYRLSNYVY